MNPSRIRAPARFLARAQALPAQEPSPRPRRLRASTIEGLIRGMPLAFQRGRADGLAARHHFSFRGAEEAGVSIDIRDTAIRIERGLGGDPDVGVTADAATWLGLVRGERSIPWALATGRVRGSIRLLRRIQQCFPS